MTYLVAKAARRTRLLGLFLAATMIFSAAQVTAEDKLPVLNVGYIFTTHHTPLIAAMAKNEEFREFGVHLRPVVDKLK